MVGDIVGNLFVIKGHMEIGAGHPHVPGTHQGQIDGLRNLVVELP